MLGALKTKAVSFAKALSPTGQVRLRKNSTPSNRSEAEQLGQSLAPFCLAGTLS